MEGPSLGEPLLAPNPPRHAHTPIGRRCLAALTACAFFLYVLLGTVERVSFARMAFAMPSGVLLMHTLLALMSLMFFTLLQIARTQSPEQLADAPPQTLHLGDVLSIAVLDVLHSLLALAGATVVPGVTQALLIQAAVPAVALFAVLLPAEPPVTSAEALAAAAAAAVAASDGRKSDVRTTAAAPPATKRPPSLRLRLMNVINNHSPAQLCELLVRSPHTYQAIAAVAIAIAVTAVTTTPPADADDDVFSGVVNSAVRRATWAPAQALAVQAQLPAAAAAMMSRAPRQLMPSPGDWPVPSRFQSPPPPQSQQQQEEPSRGDNVSDGTSLNVDGRWLLLLGSIISALASAHKQRCLSRRPTDLLVFNTSLSAVQLFAGLVLAPPLLLLLYGRPVKDTLIQLARGLRCCLSGFNPNICGDNKDAFGAPHLLTFFIASTAWSSTSFGLLRLGGALPLALGSALLLPLTVLAFVRPVALPYAWAAPPEPLSSAHAKLSALLLLALCVYHLAAVAMRPRPSRRLMSPRVSKTSPADLPLGPSLEM